MKKAALFAGLAFLLALSACRTQTIPATPTALPLPVARDSPLRVDTQEEAVVEPAANQASSADEPLIASISEVISAQNAVRLRRQTYAGEGYFPWDGNLALSPDGRQLAISTTTGVLRVDAQSGLRTGFIPLGEMAADLTFSPDGARLLISTWEADGSEYASGVAKGSLRIVSGLYLYDWPNQRFIRKYDLQQAGCGATRIFNPAFSPDGSRIAFQEDLAFENAFNICVIDAQSGEIRLHAPLRPPWRADSSLWFSADGSRLGVILRDGRSAAAVHIYSGSDPTPQTAAILQGLPAVEALSLSPDLRLAAVAGRDALYISQLPDDQAKPICHWSEKQVETLAFSPDSQYAALGAGDALGICALKTGEMRWLIRNFQTASLAQTPDAPQFKRLLYSPQGDRLYALIPRFVSGSSGEILAFSLPSGESLFHLYGSFGQDQPAVSPSLKLAAFGDFPDGQIQIWSFSTHTPLWIIAHSPARATCFSFSTDDRLLAFGNAAGTVGVLRSHDGSEVWSTAGHSGEVRALAWNRAGDRFASLGADGQLIEWNPAEGSMLSKTQALIDDPNGNQLAYSADDQTLMIASGCLEPDLCGNSESGGLTMVDLRTRQSRSVYQVPVQTFTASDDWSSLAVTSRGTALLTRQTDGRYQLSRDFFSPFGTGAILGAGLTPDAALFLSGNGYGLHVWDTSTHQLAALIKAFPYPYGKFLISQDQKALVIKSGGSAIHLWSVRAED